VDGEFDDSVARQLTAKFVAEKKWQRIFNIVRACYLFPYVFLQNCVLHREDTPFVLKGPSLGRTSSWSRPVDLRLIKNIKRDTKCSVNDVVMTCMGQAVRRCFIRKGMKLPDVFRTASAVSYMEPNKPLVMENSLSTALLDLPMNCPDTVKALQQFNSSADLLKFSTLFITFYFMMKYTVNALPYKLARFVITNLEASMIVTNTPLFASKVNLMGHMLEDAGFVCPYRGRAGSSMTFMTYGDEVRAGITVDKSLLPEKKDLDQIMEDFEEEVKQLALGLGIDINNPKS
jgi:hypothetical protein